MFPLVFAAAVVLDIPVDVRDLERFPDARETALWVDFGVAYRKWCREEASATPWAYRRYELTDCVYESQMLSSYWNVLHNCHGAVYDDTKLYHLKELRSRLGYQKYYSGIMPEPAPWWRWRLIER